MKIEHVAFQMADPVAAARWYCHNLGFSVVRSTPDTPFACFLVDGSGNVMIEIYNNPKATVPDYRKIDPLVLHLAFQVDDVDAVRKGLLAAGATAEGEATVTDGGDRIAMLRDPWGLAVQLVRRKQPMV